MRITLPYWVRIPSLLVCGVIGLTGYESRSQHEVSTLVDRVSNFEKPEPEPRAPAGRSVVAEPTEAELRADPRVRAFVHVYDSLIDSVSYQKDDLVFFIKASAIHFEDGRMLSSARLDRREQCDPVFYIYPLEFPEEPIAPPEEPIRHCTDVQEALWGRSESQIREHASSSTFLGRRVFLNDLAIQALVDVEREIRALATVELKVAEWIDELDIAYSLIDRGIAGTPRRSQHAWGLAVDLVPRSYDGQQVYWRWTRAWNGRGWHQIPMEQRWSPPASVVRAFESHGFLWGGKWAHFDNIHFEYRPELLEYNKLILTED